MPVVQFQCPNCQAPLRLENRALFVGRTFACPDCRETLLIESQGSTGVSARLTKPEVGRNRDGEVGRVPTHPTTPPPQHATPLDLGVQLQPRTASWYSLIGRPALVGWSVAAIFAITLFVVVNSGSERPSRDTIVLANTKPRTTPESSAKIIASGLNSAEKSVPAAASNKAVVQSVVDPKQDQASAEFIDRVKIADALTSQPVPKVTAEKAAKTADGDLKPPQNPVVPVPLAPELPNEPPVEQPRKETAESIDLKLQQKIVRFDQPKPVAFVKLLDDVEALAGVSIVWDLQTVDEEQLQKPVTLKLQQTTVGEILDALLMQVGLKRRVVEGRIELRPAQ